MFSGIVEISSSVAAVREGSGTLQLEIKKPSHFDDLSIGDSIAVDGVCLTLEKSSNELMTFTLGPETLRVTGWSVAGVLNRIVNLERSLRMGDRVHGHLVTGHVDSTAKVLNAEWEGQSLRLTIEIPHDLKNLIWAKGSVAVNGVSLTVNQVTAAGFSVGLIPETLRRTNLGSLKPGDIVNLEADNFARGLAHFAKGNL